VIVPRLDSDGKFPEIYGKVQPYGSFAYVSGNQTSGGTTTANKLLFDTDLYKSRLIHDTVTNSERVQFIDGGIYAFHVQCLVNATAGGKNFDLWLLLNGSNVANSNVHESLPNSGDQLITRTYIISVSANDYIEWNWCSRDDAGLILETQSAGASPTTPVAPCALLTVSRISL
jgi:hypothetical protein